MGKPTILIITELYPNVDNHFLGTFVVSQLNELKKYYKIVIIVPYVLGIWERMKVKQPPLIQYKNMDIYYIKQYPLPLLLPQMLGLLKQQTVTYWNKILIGKILRLAKKLHKKYQFSLVHGHEAYIGDEAVTIGQMLNIPSIVTIHGLYNYHKLGFGEKVMNIIIKNLNNANRLFAVSKIAASSYQQNGVNRKIEIIPNGLSKNIAEQKNPLPEKWQKIIQNKTVILTVGFFVKEKRFEQVIQASSILKKQYGDSFIVLMIGRGELEKYYRHLISKNGLNQQVIIVGQVNPSDMDSYYNAADFLVHPSIIESFSMVCLEVMSAGKPFICTSNIGLVEYITPNEEAFVISPDNVNALTEKMEVLLRDTKLRQMMGEKARLTAQKFLWGNQINKTISVYEQLVKS